jgi:hypothetical protein
MTSLMGALLFLRLEASLLLAQKSPVRFHHRRNDTFLSIMEAFSSSFRNSSFKASFFLAEVLLDSCLWINDYEHSDIGFVVSPTRGEMENMLRLAL